MAAGTVKNLAGSMLRLSSATSRAVDPPVRACFCTLDEKRRSAGGATSLQRAAAEASSFSEDLIVADEVGGAAPHVAAWATRHQVVEGVVVPVRVDVVNDKRPSDSSDPLHPLHFGSAPVASVGSGPDFGVEQEAMFADESSRTSQRVASCDDGAVVAAVRIECPAARTNLHSRSNKPLSDRLCRAVRCLGDLGERVPVGVGGHDLLDVEIDRVASRHRGDVIREVG